MHKYVNLEQLPCAIQCFIRDFPSVSIVTSLDGGFGLAEAGDIRNYDQRNAKSAMLTKQHPRSMFWSFPFLSWLFSLLFGDDSESIFSILNDTAVTMNGVIDSNIEGDFADLLEDLPNLNLIIMEDCPGSDDDTANLKVSRMIHDQGINTHLRSSSEIASGAVDLFLAGNTRTLEGTPRIGVHSWADGDGNEATDFPEGASEHQPYIRYYQDVGFTQSDAESFYYFTINAASAEDIYWMTASEIEQYNIATN